MTARIGYSTARVAIVCPILVRYDAISQAGRDTYRILADDPGFAPVMFTSRNEYPDIPAHVVSGVGDLLLHPAFLSADVVVYHFGIYSDLFDALIARKGRARQIAHFHNITPVQFVPQHRAALIEKSFRQIHNLRLADELWAVSEVNAFVLREYGVEKSRIQTIPIIVERPPLCSFRTKRPSPLDILFIGRFVPAKGALDLIEAVSLVRRWSSRPFRVRLVGNLEFSDIDFPRKVECKIESAGLTEIVKFHGTVDDPTAEDFLQSAHILAMPSYHEGFCKPVVEALRSGAIPVGYASYNVPAAVNGFGRLVAAGDIEALATALMHVMEGVSRALETPGTSELPLDRGLTSLADFEILVRDYVSRFTFNNLAPIIRSRVRQVLS